MRTFPPLRVRFDNAYVPVPESGCWLWLAATDQDGYGVIKANGKHERAHRVSWLIHRGELPEGAHVLHKCDTPACVNPEHLFLGDNTTNTADRVAKGRSARQRGERHGMARLSVEAVRRIRRDTRYQKVIAAEHGISQSAVSVIKSGRRWGHLTSQTKEFKG